MRNIIALLTICLSASFAIADDAKDIPPIKPIPRLLPPKGVDIGKDERDKLEARLAALTKAIKDAKLDKDLGPDVEIYTKAVRWAIDFDEFYDAKKDIAKAHAALDSAQKRLDAIKAGKPTWPEQRGLLARGYRSEIDDSVQPYGLHIPPPEKLDLSKPVPLLVWLHGRGDKETDLHFIASREKSKGEFAPDWCITLHPYGRGTIGFKFAGEIDVLDAIESVKKRYKIDEDRIALAGFSMGGAGAWHIGAHYADRFCVVHAGAGFVETAKYNRLTPDKYPAWYEQKLWGWYDVPCYTRNLFNVPVIAYSGEKDKQIQAAREMEAAFKAEGRTLNHIIGPGVEHKYEAKAKEEILKQIKAAVDKGREKWPKKVSLQTRTLRYGQQTWLRITKQEHSWSDTRVEVDRTDNRHLKLVTTNVAAMRILGGNFDMVATIDGQRVEMPIQTPAGNDRIRAFVKVDGKWSNRLGKWPRDPFLILASPQPIDHVFMAPFIVVAPSGPAANPKVQRWVDFELDHLKSRWRALFRGDLPVKTATEVTDDDLVGKHVVLFGDPSCNKWIRRFIAPVSELHRGEEQVELPLQWTGADFILGGTRWSGSDHLPCCVLPIRRTFSGMCIVLNSGPTFREGHDRTNSQQTPKLPDWAIIGLDKDPDALSPGEIKAAGFFDENWKVKKEEKK